MAEAHAPLSRGYARQKTIVITMPAADAASVGVEEITRNENEVSGLPARHGACGIGGRLEDARVPGLELIQALHAIESHGTIFRFCPGKDTLPGTKLP